MVKLLLEMGALRLCDTHNDEGWTPLHHVAPNGHFHTVEVLVQRGVKINTQNNKGNTPLHIASSNEQAEVVDFFVNKGACGYHQQRVEEGRRLGQVGGGEQYHGG